MSASRRTTTVDEIVARLARDFPDTDLATVSRIVSETYDALIATRVHIHLYIPNLVEHDARERLIEIEATHPRTA